ncbi:uncharacterized protein LOC122368952 [Amphibalanus amphitrite]|uniref:uncharacterized protein LOC122368952 n=1 Tax=Amphibalanus amphitrite TaxID=1232801 RepID=UPI001C90BD29|nr:uncharacterized protein LOC122368952 [Amphibalanus amphitrite]
MEVRRMTAALLLLTAVSVGAMRAPDWGWDDDFLKPHTNAERPGWFRHTPPMAPDQNPWESLKNSAGVNQSVSAEDESNDDAAQTAEETPPPKPTQTAPIERSDTAPLETEGLKDHWEALKNAVVSKQNTTASERSDNSTVQITESQEPASFTPAGQTDTGLSSTESISPGYTLIKKVNQTHDYQGDEQPDLVTESPSVSDTSEDNNDSGEHKNDSDDQTSDEGAEVAIKNLTLTEAPDEEAAEDEKSPSVSGQVNSGDRGGGDVGIDDVLVIFPDEINDYGENEIDEKEAFDEEKRSKLVSREDQSSEKANDTVVAETKKDIVLDAEASTLTPILQEKSVEDEAAADDVPPTTSNNLTVQSPHQLANTLSPEAKEDLVAGETRQTGQLDPVTRRHPSPKDDRETSLLLSPTEATSLLSMGGTTTAVTISDRRLDDTGDELRRLLQDASRSTTISLTSPDFSNGTFVATTFHRKQNPWLQRYAPFFYPENPEPETIDELERRQEPAPELRRLRIEHLVLVPPSSYPDEVLRTVHDAKLRALPKPQEDVHINLGQNDGGRKPTIEELARGAEYVSQEKVQNIGSANDARHNGKAQSELHEKPPHSGVIHNEPLEWIPLNDAEQPDENGDTLLLHPPVSGIGPRPGSDAGSGHGGFSQPKLEDILPNQPGEEVNHRPLPAGVAPGNGYMKPKPEDILSTAEHGELDHRLPAYAPPISDASGLDKKDAAQGFTGDTSAKGIRPDKPNVLVLPPPIPANAEPSLPDVGTSTLPLSTPSGYSSPKLRDVVTISQSGRLVPLAHSPFSSPGDASSGGQLVQNINFSPPKPDDVIPLSESFMYDAARATAAGVPEEQQDEYGAPKLSSIVGSTRVQVKSVTPGRNPTQDVIADLAMKEVAPPELGQQGGLRGPKLVDLLRPHAEGTRSRTDKGKDGYGTPKPSHIINLDDFQLSAVGVLDRLDSRAGDSIQKEAQQGGGAHSTENVQGVARLKPEDVILASGDFVGVPDFRQSSADNNQASDSPNDKNPLFSALLATRRKTKWNTNKEQGASDSGPDTRENSVYYIPSTAQSPPKPGHPSPTAHRFTPTSIYDVLAFPEPRGLPDGSAVGQRPGSEPSLDSPLYADAGWRPSLSPFGELGKDGGQMSGRRLDEQVEDEDRWVWPRTTRTADVTGRVLFRET